MKKGSTKKTAIKGLELIDPNLVREFAKMPNLDKAMKSIAEFSRNLHRQITEVIESLKSAGIFERLLEIAELYEIAKETSAETYEKQFRSMEHFFKKEGLILPADYLEFANWFFLEKRKVKVITRENVKALFSVQPETLWEFSEWKKTRYYAAVEALRSKGSVKEPLPLLPEMVNDADTFLPRLWVKLAEMPKPLVTKKGRYIWKGKNVSVLTALAQALISGDKINGDFETEDIYRALCRYFEQPEADRPRIEGNTHTGFTHVYNDYLAAFNNVLGNL